jgi:dolichol-phosphate mannosyltransferase
MIHIMLPAYNESLALPQLLDAIRQVEWRADEVYKVVVVDDGSTDATVPACRARWDDMPLDVICHGRNLGLGSAMLTGLKHCVSNCGGKDVIVAMDADNTHPPALIPDMLRAIESGSDIVIASRYAEGGREIGLAPARKILSRGASTLLKVAFPIPGTRDYTCGYRAYSSGILERGFRAYSDRLIEQKGFVCMAELLVKLGALGARVSEVPLVLRYDLKQGASKMKVTRTIAGYLKLVTVSRPRVPARIASTNQLDQRKPRATEREWGSKGGKREK